MPVETSIAEGLAHFQQGKWEQAVDCCNAVLAREPGSIEAMHLLGRVHLRLLRYEEAADVFERCLRARSSDASLYLDYSESLICLGLHPKARDIIDQGLKLEPKNASLFNNLGRVLKAVHEYDAALDAYQRAITLNPAFAEAWNNMGSALLAANRLDDALAAFRAALRINPKYAKAHLNEGIAHLLKGEWRLGWLKYEYRWLSVLRIEHRALPSRRWFGDVPLQGQSILLYAEQGLGDSLQFLRFIPPVLAQGAEVHLEIQPALRDLAALSFPSLSSVTAQGSEAPSTSFHCPLVSLGLALAVQEHSIPRKVPYLTVPPEELAEWTAELCRLPGRRIGFVWAGNPRNTNDRNRSIPLAQFARVLRGVPGRFFSLQLEGGLAAHLESDERSRLTDLGPRLRSFVDTAAILKNMDLVVTVDTAVAHLAGALGIPVWILLPYAPDWRWRLERTDSTWYPSARLFRQSRPGDWSEVLATVSAELGGQ